MTRKLIFLDVDGVLNCDATFAREPSEHTKNLPKNCPEEERLFARMKDMLEPEMVERFNSLVERSGAEVVVSSSWRLHFESFERLRFFFEAIGGIVPGKIIAMTPRVYPGMRFSESPLRGKQIQAYLDENHNGEDDLRIVILDDNDEMAHLRPRFVRTNERFGLTETDVQEALKILNRPGEEHCFYEW